MVNDSKLWPINQFQQWLHSCDNKKFSAIPRTALPTLLALLKFAHNETWECNPSYSSLANLSFLHRDRIIEHIKLLENSRIINVKRQDNKNNEYKINTENLWISGAFCKLPSRKTRLPSRKTRLAKVQTSRKTRPELAFVSNYVTKKAFSNKIKIENQKKHDFAESMNQMAQEKKKIDEHEKRKLEEIERCKK